MNKVQEPQETPMTLEEKVDYLVEMCEGIIASQDEFKVVQDEIVEKLSEIGLPVGGGYSIEYES
jgi:hypothetical protein